MTLVMELGSIRRQIIGERSRKRTLHHAPPKNELWSKLREVKGWSRSLTRSDSIALSFPPEGEETYAFWFRSPTHGETGRYSLMHA